MRFELVDDFLDATFANAFEELMLKFQWNYCQDVNYGTIPPNHQENPGVVFGDARFQSASGFSRAIFPGSPNDSPWFQQSQYILKAFLNKLGIHEATLVRIKANLLTRSATMEQPKPFPPHVDLPKPHMVMIYYVNDSDGDTLIFDKTFPDRENCTMVHSASPKKGRGILFDGRHYHTGTAPFHHDTRMVVNFNFLEGKT